MDASITGVYQPATPPCKHRTCVVGTNSGPAIFDPKKSTVWCADSVFCKAKFLLLHVDVVAHYEEGARLLRELFSVTGMGNRLDMLVPQGLSIAYEDSIEATTNSP